MIWWSDPHEAEESKKGSCVFIERIKWLSNNYQHLLAAALLLLQSPNSVCRRRRRRIAIYEHMKWTKPVKLFCRKSRKFYSHKTRNHQMVGFWSSSAGRRTFCKHIFAIFHPPHYTEYRHIHIFTSFYSLSGFALFCRPPPVHRWRRDKNQDNKVIVDEQVSWNSEWVSSGERRKAFLVLSPLWCCTHSWVLTNGDNKERSCIACCI